MTVIYTDFFLDFVTTLYTIFMV